MDDRIKLCEAMGWTWDVASCKRLQLDDSRCYWIKPNGLKWYPAKAMPDPFTDANDDYAVLEWIRKDYRFQKFKGQLRWLNTSGTLSNRSSEKTWMYQIGDYARAALKVIGETK